MTGNATITRWNADIPPSEAAIRRIYAAEGLQPHIWGNSPGDRYAFHAHPYHKVLYCLEGSIRFVLGDGTALDLAPGDRLDLPPGTAHAAIVGPEGVRCIEAPRFSTHER